MKFYLVPIGQQFKHQGELYTKSGPLTAHTETNQKDKLIPRSANVEILSNMVSPDEIVTEQQAIPLKDILVTINQYHTQCLESLNTIKDDIDNHAYLSVQEKMDIAYKALLDSLQ